MHTFIVPSTLSKPLSAKDFLRRHCGLSLASWRKLKTGGEILRGSKSLQPMTSLQPGDPVTVRWFTPPTSLQPIEMPLSILFEDDALLIINKPAGILVHPSTMSSEPTIANGVVHYFQTNPYCHFHPVHRLDRNTSGALVIAKTPHVQHVLSQNNFSLQRKYWALIEGSLQPSEGLIDLPIGRAPDSIILRRIAADGQPAQTNYRTIKTGASHSWLELELLTGRTHQIRVHLAAIGHPLLGDDLYGGSIAQIARQALHSFYVSFKHPLTSEQISLEVPWPQDISTVAVDLFC